VLRHLLKVACEEWSVVSTTPRIRLEREPQGRLRWLTEDEEHRLTEACRKSRNSELIGIVTVALETGLRQAAALVDVDRVDFSRNVIRLEVTKSGRRREVPMRQVVYEALSNLPGPREGRIWTGTNLRKSWTGRG